jgi:ion channel-forming bestrophin family protein
LIDYDPHIWRDHLLDFRGSVLRKVLPRVLVVTIWSGLVGWFHHAVHPVNIPSTAHALVGLALGLLLVFRTNASYDRFWEGRRQWGAIVNATRNLARGSAVFMQGAPELGVQLRLWTAGFAAAVMHRLRDQASLGDVAAALPPENVATSVKSGNVPLAAAIFMSSAIAEARRRSVLTAYEQMLMDTQVAYLIDAAGACDRIHRTPLPFAYVVHLRRCLSIYCLTLPFATLDGFGWGQVAVSTLVAFILLGIEEIGVEIEDPFGSDENDLPLEEFCQTVQRDLSVGASFSVAVPEL